MYYLHDIVKVPLCKIVVEMERHPRAVKDQNTINDYAEALLEGIRLPPIDVFRDGENLLLADGLHRYEAYKQKGFDHIPAIVHQGCKTEFLLHALGANADHGLRRTNADKRKAVIIALTEPDLQGLSDNQIAEICKVTQPFASKIRKFLTNNGYKFALTRLTANGRKINVKKIGKKKKVVTGPTDPVKEKEGAGNPPPETGPVNNPQGLNSGGSGDNTPKEEQPGAGQTNGELSGTNPAPGEESGAPEDTEPPVTTDEGGDPKGTEPPVTTDEDGGPEDTEPPVTTGEGGDPKGTEPPVTTAEGDGPEDTEPPVTTDEGGGPEDTEPPVITDEDGDESDGVNGDDGQVNSDLDDKDSDALKRMVIDLRGTIRNHEATIETQSSYIAELEQQVEYLVKELQGSIKAETEVSAILAANSMNTDQIVTQA